MKKNTPRVSFILPTRDRPEFVVQALKNARQYLSVQDELIVVDASHDDSTKSVVKKFPRLVTRYLKTKDKSEGHGMNIGILNSRGRIIKPISDDDFIYPKAMKKAIQILDADDELDALQCGGEGYVYDSKKGRAEYSFSEKISPQIKIAQNYRALLDHAICHFGLLFKRRLLPEIGLYDSGMTAADIDIMSKIIRAGVAFKYLDVCLYRHIQYPHSAELIKDQQVISDRVRVFLSLTDLKSALWEDAAGVQLALGLSNTNLDRGMLTLIRLSNYLTSFALGRVILQSIGYTKKFFESLNLNSTANKLNQAEKKPKPKIIWTGKYW